MLAPCRRLYWSPVGGRSLARETTLLWRRKIRGRRTKSSILGATRCASSVCE